MLDLCHSHGDTRAMDERELIYDWNRVQAPFDWSRARVDLNDETLRDGLQSPSVRDPSLEVKKRLLHLMADRAIEAATFIGSSPIRQYAEDWTLDRILEATEQAVTYAAKHGLPVMYVTEDTTRAKPEAVKALYGAAISCGATRICLADTVGHATPDGVKALVRFVREEIVAGKDVKVDWHGHRDRGMG